LAGNVLDERIRKSQDDQTIGIPISPDTSFIIAETVLTAFDKLLVSKYTALRGFRYIDDMEFGFGTYREAQEALAQVRDILREFELSTNDTKTRIIELPVPLDETWVAELRGFAFRTNKTKYLQSDIATFFDKLFSLQAQFPDDTVIKYGVQQLRSIPFDAKSWEFTQRYLFQCLMVDTSTFLVILPLLQSQQKAQLKVDLSTLTHIINYQIQECCPMYFGNEVAWALWAAIYWNLHIGKKAAVALSNMTDPVVAVIALDAHQRGLIPNDLDTTRWEQFLNREALYEPQWLLAYEANVKGWLPQKGKTDYVASDSCFGLMKAAGVSFYDPAKVRSAKLTSAAPSNTVVPLFSFDVESPS